MESKSDPLALMKTQPPRSGRAPHNQGNRAGQNQDIRSSSSNQRFVVGVQQRKHQAVLRSRYVVQLQLDLSAAAAHLSQQNVRRVGSQVVPPVALPDS
jgi:hypothetical protein